MTPDQSHWPLILSNENRNRRDCFTFVSIFLYRNFRANVTIAEKTVVNKEYIYLTTDILSVKVCHCAKTAQR